VAQGRVQEPVHAVEHHHFSLDGREWLLFDALSLAVVDSCPTDGTLLDLASHALTPRALASQAIAAGCNPVEVRTRARVLRDRRFLVRTGDESPPAPLEDDSRYATFMINVSQRCNLTCAYCYVNRGDFDYATKPIARMSATTAARVVEAIHDRFPAFGTYGYHFYGGEPLLNFDAIRCIVRAAEEAAARTQTATDFHVTTNGTLLSRQIADFFDEHRFNVYVSIDGDQPSHDQYRKYAGGRGSFADVERNLRYLRTKKRIHLIGSTVVRKGLPLRDAIELLTQHGADQCKAERVRLRPSDPLALQGGERDRYLDDIRALSDHYVSHLEANRKPPDFRLTSRILQLLVRQRRDFFCPAGERMFGIAANGEVYPCALQVGRPEARLGDLDSGVDGVRQRQFRARIHVDARPECRACWSRNLCGGGCSANVGRFGTDDCPAMRAESEAAIATYSHFARTDPTKLYALVDPSIVTWIAGEDADA
jgi:uncharacterized protein